MDNREKKNSKPAVKLGTKSQHAELFYAHAGKFRRARGPQRSCQKPRCQIVRPFGRRRSAFPNDFRKEHDVAWVLDKFGALEGEALDSQEDVFAIAGRIVSLRSFGKVAFFHIMDQKRQLHIQSGTIWIGFRSGEKAQTARSGHALLTGSIGHTKPRC